MLRITKREAVAGITLVVEGKFRGPWVDELEKCWHEAADTYPGRTVSVDLEGVGFVDEHGKELLKRMCAGGVRLVATGPMMTSLVEDVLASCAEAGQRASNSVGS